MTDGPATSPEMAAYFAELSAKKDECYAIAEKARSMGFDPETSVEIPQAEDLASRVRSSCRTTTSKGWPRTSAGSPPSTATVSWSP